MVAITVATNVTIRTGAQGVKGTPGGSVPHAPTHSKGGADPVTVENLATASTDTNQVLKPDGANGLVFASESGGGGTVGFGWNFSLTATMVDPGSGFFRVNNADQTLATQMAISDLTDNGLDVGDAIDNLRAGDFIYVQESTNTANFRLYEITSTPTDNTGWHQIAVTYNNGGAALTATLCGFALSRGTIVAGNVNSPGGETSGNLAEFTGPNAIDETSITTASVSGHLASTSNPHTVTAAQLGAQLLSEKDQANGYPGLGGDTRISGAQQRYGIASDTACEGDDARLSDARTPTGSATGDLAGTYGGPSVKALTTTTGPTSLVIGAVADGELLGRVGSTIIGVSPAGVGDVVGPAGGVVDGEIALYDSTTGKLIKGSSTQVADLVADADLINSSAGAGDAGKPIKLDAAGHVDATMVNDADIDHTAIANIGTNDHAAIDTHIADMDNPHGITGKEDLITGVLTGGLITVNGGDPTLFDVAAGTAIVEDWSTPATPVRTEVSFGPFVGEAIPTSGAFFANVFINAAGGIVKAIVEPTPQQRKTLARLQAVLYDGADNVVGTSTDRGLAFQVTATLIDYINKIGVINEDNRLVAASTDLTVGKTAGTTTLPFVNATIDTQDAATKVNVVVASFANVSTTFRDGVGGFTVDGTPTGIQPGLFDDDSGTLAAVPNNRWTVQRFYFTGVSSSSTLVMGQDHYANRSDAIASIETEAPEISPLLDTGQTIITTFLVVQEGTTDLTSAGALFLDNNSFTGGAGTGSVPGTWIGLLDTIDLTYAAKAGMVPMVNVGESGLELIPLDHALHLSNVGANTHAQIDTHIADMANPHAVTAAQTGAATLTPTPADDEIILGDGTATNVRGGSLRLNEIGSIGVIGDPENIVQPDTGTEVKITAHTALFKVTASLLAKHVRVDISEIDALAIPIDTVKFVGVDYNGGSPIAIVSDSNDEGSFNLLTQQPLAKVSRDSTGIYITDIVIPITDIIARMAVRMAETDLISYVSGLILGTSGVGDDKVTVSEGRVYILFLAQTYAALDTNVAGSFDLYTGSTGFFSVDENITDYPADEYNDGTATPATLNNNRFGTIWWYIDVDTGQTLGLLGTSNVNSIAEAGAELAPSDLPPRIASSGFLMGRFIITKGDHGATIVESTFLTGEFATEGVTVHSSLSGLLANDHPIYQLGSEKGDPSGYASLDANTILVEPAQVLRTTTGPTNLTIGAVADGEVLVRSGSTIIGGTAGSHPIPIGFRRRSTTPAITTTQNFFDFDVDVETIPAEFFTWSAGTFTAQKSFTCRVDLFCGFTVSFSQATVVGDIVVNGVTLIGTSRGTADSFDVPLLAWGCSGVHNFVLNDTLRAYLYTTGGSANTIADTLTICITPMETNP